MTAAEGGPALGALAATPAGGVGGSRVTVRSRAPRARMVLGLATVEAWMLFRSLLVLAGLLAGGLVIWILIHPVQPLWWNVAWQIGYGQAVLGMAVFIAAHLAAGRARRDGMADLYASFPAAASTRTLGQLTGLAGALPASLLLIGGTAAVVQMLGPVGVPGIAALAGGLLLVIAAGAAGIAICTRFPHPLAGVLAGLALFVPVVESNNINGAGSWLLPWHEPGQLGYLPGPLAGELQGGLGRGDYTEVRNNLVALWAYPGSSVGGYLTPPGAVPPTTAAGYLLAKAITSLPEQKVARVLAGAWGRWLNWRTTDAQLAAALGIPMPSVPAPPAALMSPPPGAIPPPPNPLCTT